MHRSRRVGSRPPGVEVLSLLSSVELDHDLLAKLAVDPVVEADRVLAHRLQHLHAHLQPLVAVQVVLHARGA